LMDRGVRINMHGSEFETAKSPALPISLFAAESPPRTHPVLHEKHGPWGIQPDRDGDQEHQGQ
jgi:hypothetical protein